MLPVVTLTANASGATWAGRQGLVVVVVDVIDMSTSLEAALDEGAAAVLGASPDEATPPVAVDPTGVGRLAAEKACALGTDLVIITEPRTGSDEERRGGIQKVLAGIAATGVRVKSVLPNLGASVAALVDFRGKVVVAATGSGGVAFDAALTAGAPAVFPGTVARTRRKKGREPALAAANRAVAAAKKLHQGIAVVAASSNSLEDVLAAQYIYRLVLELF